MQSYQIGSRCKYVCEEWDRCGVETSIDVVQYVLYIVRIRLNNTHYANPNILE